MEGIQTRFEIGTGLHWSLVLSPEGGGAALATNLGALPRWNIVDSCCDDVAFLQSHSEFLRRNSLGFPVLKVHSHYVEPTGPQ